MKNFKENFNFLTNIFILILLFFGGLSYADTNGIWQFANDTRPGVFGLDEGAGIGNNYTFINPVYFNLGLTSTGFTRISELHSNLFYANNVTIASQLTLSGVNCDSSHKLRTDAFGNVVCSQDNINDSVHNLATMKTAVSNDFHNLGGIDRVNDGVYNLATMKIAVSNDFHNLGGIDRVNDGVYNLATMRTAALNDFHNLGGIDKDTWITTQACGTGLILKSVGKNSKNCVSIKWAEVTGKPIPKNCKKGFYMTDINIGGGTIGCKKLPTQGITTETDPQVRTVTSGKWCTGVAGGKIDCTSAAPSSGGSIIVPAILNKHRHCTGNGYRRRCQPATYKCPTGYSPLAYKFTSIKSLKNYNTLAFCYK